MYFFLHPHQRRYYLNLRWMNLFIFFFNWNFCYSTKVEFFPIEGRFQTFNLNNELLQFSKLFKVLKNNNVKLIFFLNLNSPESGNF